MVKIKINAWTVKIHNNLQNYPILHSQESLVNLVRRRGSFVGLFILVYELQVQVIVWALCFLALDFCYLFSETGLRLERGWTRPSVGWMWRLFVISPLASVGWQVYSHPTRYS